MTDTLRQNIILAFHKVNFFWSVFTIEKLNNQSLPNLFEGAIGKINFASIILPAWYRCKMANGQLKLIRLVLLPCFFQPAKKGGGQRVFFQFILLVLNSAIWRMCQNVAKCLQNVKIFFRPWHQNYFEKNHTTNENIAIWRFNEKSCSTPRG